MTSNGSAPIGRLMRARQPTSLSATYVPTAVRWQYEKLDRQCPTLVIVDVHLDGSQAFSEQAPGEVQWFPFEPTPEERAAVNEGIQRM